jgi:hypothetical protein
MLSRNIVFIIIPLLLFNRIYAGNVDSVILTKKNTTTRFFTENHFEYKDSTQQINNSINNFQNYVGRNYLGNLGLPFNSIHPTTITNKIGFNYNKNNYDPYFYALENLKFYNTRAPFTDLLYVTGVKREQLFKMVFSYNVKKNWNVTANFSSIRSDGFYERQTTNHCLVALSTNYKSLNDRYYLLAGIIYNNIRNEENGGIANDSLFENSRVIDKNLIGINLLSAKKKGVNRTVFFKQYLNFGKKSNDTSLHNAIIPESRFILTTQFNDNFIKYEDDVSSENYYSNFYFDTLKTNDSTFHSKIENELLWKRIDNTRHRGFVDQIGVSASIKHQLVRVNQYDIDTAISNIIGGGSIYNTYSRHKLWWNVSFKYGLSGFNKSDYVGAAIIKKRIIDSLSFLSLFVEKKLQTPDFMYQQYLSNNFRWNNHFNQQQQTHFAINLTINKFGLALGADYINYENVLYFDNDAVASQYDGSIGVVTMFMKKDFTFYNWHLNNKMNYQYVPDSTVIKLPEYVFEHALYYENDLLKGVLRLQIGASLFYNSAYFANAYMPATSQFYLQDNKKYGNYPMIDFFINAQIKTVRIFIKIDHLNYGWMGNNYLFTPDYPMNDRALKFGVSWKFFN